MIDGGRLWAWAAREDLLAGDGRVLSWVNPEHPGYPYDEITALHARLWTWSGRNGHRASQLAEVVEARIAADGWLVRGGVTYAFDTALALPLLRDAAPVADRIAERLRERRACDPVARPGWWSESYGPHLIKSAALLSRAGHEEFARDLASDLVARCFDGERFRIHEASERTYTHAACYAIEGLMMLGEAPQRAIEWLARAQAADGSFAAWFAEQGALRPADAAAQAVRIWAAYDARRYAPQIERGLRYLASLQDRETGGIAYTSGSRDLNTWAAAFTLQALAWVERPPDGAEIQAWL